MTATAIIAAGGSGQRFGKSTPKQFLTLFGRPIIFHTLRAFERAKTISDVIVVAPQAHMSELSPEMMRKFEITKVSRVVPGGATRQESVRLGLEAIDEKPSYVAIHDAARCLVTSELIDRTVRSCEGWDGAIAAVPVRDTLKRVEGERITSTEPRDGLWAMQTPQVFRFPLIRDLYRKAHEAKFEATDDAAVAERGNARVRVTEGAPSNWKVTVPEDLPLAESILAEGS